MIEKYSVNVKFFLLCSLIVLAFGFFYQEVKNSAENDFNLFKEEASNQVYQLLTQSVSHINYLAQLKKISSIKEELITFVKYQEHYSQVRIISKTGMEVFRINKEDERIEVVEKGNLQNKAHRYYTLEILRSFPNTYISKLDHNVENGKIQKNNITFRVAKWLGKDHFIILNISSSSLYKLFNMNKNYSFQLDKSVTPKTFVSYLYEGFMSQSVNFNNSDGVKLKLALPQWKLVITRELKKEKTFLVVGLTVTILILVVLYILFEIFKSHIRKEHEMSEIYDKFIANNFCYSLRNDKGKTLFFNERILRELEVSPLEYREKGLEQFKPKFDSIIHENDPLKYLKRGLKWEGEIEVTLKSGEVKIFSAVKAPVSHEDGSLRGYATLMFNITKQIRLENEAEAQKEALIQAGSLANIGRMSSTLSHQFSTPIGVLLSNVDIIYMELKKLPKEYPFITKKLDQMRATINELVELTHYIKNLARISNNANDGVSEVAIVRDVIEHSLRLTKPLLERCHINIIYEECEKGSVRVTGNPLFLSQVFINLINNSIFAIKLLSGPLWIKIVVESEGDYVMVNISDSGKGIDPSFVPHIFDSFYSTKDIADGSGLGLPIAKEILRRNEGDILYCEGEKFTTFKVSLKIKELVKRELAS